VIIKRGVANMRDSGGWEPGHCDRRGGWRNPAEVPFDANPHLERERTGM